MEEKKDRAEEQAVVPFFLHENAMMHKDEDNERMLNVVKIMRNIIFVLSAVIVIVVTTLVSYYTSRTAMWNDTITQLTATLAEVSNAKNSTPP